MPFVKRDEQGIIVAVSVEQETGEWQELPADSLELAAFIGSGPGPQAALGATDQDFVRVLEDVVELLIAKGVILFTELPESAQEKIMQRQRLRSELGSRLDLIGDD